MIGRTISHYRVIEKLGGGGMGVVYKAEDTELRRFVALKFLPDEIAQDPRALERLRREAQAAAALNHFHICTVHEIGEYERRLYLVMELLEGRTLEETIGGRPLQQKQILDWGTEIADALDAAHSRGVIHRDVKTSNIFITQRGHVKVLDFGLAKLAGPSADPSMSTAEASLTKAGAMVGTMLYMSPEQARGEELDARTDVFSAGAVLYEMSTGRKAFAGRTPALVLDAVLRHDPRPVQEVNPELPHELGRIVSKALEKDREMRYQSAAELRADLRRLQRSGQSSGQVVAVAPATRKKNAIVYAGVALSAIALAVLAGWLLTREHNLGPASSANYVQLTNFQDAAIRPVLSPDGRMLAFLRGDGFFGSSAPQSQLYVKLLPDGEPVQLMRNVASRSTPVFSPDGSRLAFTEVSTAFRWETWEIPILGGEPRLLLPDATGLTWIGAGRIMFSQGENGLHMGVVTATESRTDERSIYQPSTPSGMAHSSYLSPDSQWVLLAEMDQMGWLPCRLVPFEGNSTGRPVGPVGSNCTSAGWSPDGKWMYFSASVDGAFHIWRQQFPNGSPEQVTSGPMEEEGFAMSPDGTWMIASAGIRQSTVWVHDGNGDRQISGEGYSFGARFAPDGKKLYYLVKQGGSRAFVTGELWVADLATGNSERILPGFAIHYYDISKDGKRVVFSATGKEGRLGIWLAWLDRSEPPRQLTATGEYRVFFGKPGEILFAAEGTLERIKEDGSGRAKILEGNVIFLVNASPDGKWAVVVMSTERKEIPHIVMAFPLEGGKPIRICEACSLGSGPARSAAPLVSWSRDGKYLYLADRYFSGMGTNKTFVVPLRPGAALPQFPSDGLKMEKDIQALGVARVIPERDVFPGPSPDGYAFARTSAQRNLYRIELK